MNALMMEAASTSEMSANFFQTKRHNNSEDSHLQIFFSVDLAAESICALCE
jgi:hypothetical protein